MGLKHTPGPLSAHYHGSGYGISRRRDGASQRIADVHGTSKRDEATAHRLAACYNACEGINPDAVPELLKAAKPVLGWLEDQDGETVYKLRGLFRAAIAKAEGE